ILCPTLFCLITLPHAVSSLFPYTTLFRSGVEVADSEAETVDEPSGAHRRRVDVSGRSDDVGALPALIIGVADACLVAVDHGTDFAQLYSFETLTDIGDGRIAAPRALGRRS